MNGLSATQSFLSLAVRPFQLLAARLSHREPVPSVLSGFVHDVEVDFEPMGSGCYVADASEIGLPPRRWPSAIRYRGDEYQNAEVILDARGGFYGYDYISGAGARFAVLNS